MEVCGFRDTFACNEYEKEDESEWSADSTDISENTCTNKLTKFNSKRMGDKLKKNSCYISIRRLRPTIRANVGNIQFKTNPYPKFSCIRFGKELMSQQLKHIYDCHHYPPRYTPWKLNKSNDSLDDCTESEDLDPQQYNFSEEICERCTLYTGSQCLSNNIDYLESNGLEQNAYFSPQFNIREFIKNDFESELMVFNDSNQKYSDCKQLKNYKIETAYKNSFSESPPESPAQKTNFQFENKLLNNYDYFAVGSITDSNKIKQSKAMFGSNSHKSDKENKQMTTSCINEYETSCK